MTALLETGERERAWKFFFERDRLQYIVSHAALRTVLSLYCSVPARQIEFRANVYGKPAFPPDSIHADLCFNLSHSGGTALIAVAEDAEVGVDVEQNVAERAEPDIARKFFSPSEVASLLRLPAADRTAAFFRCWTRKEAFIKGKGLGLSLDLGLFDVSLAPGQPAALLASRENPSDVSRWQMCDIPSDETQTAALAVDGNQRVVRCWEWEPKRFRTANM